MPSRLTGSASDLAISDILSILDARFLKDGEAVSDFNKQKESWVQPNNGDKRSRCNIQRICSTFHNENLKLNHGDMILVPDLPLPPEIPHCSRCDRRSLTLPTERILNFIDASSDEREKVQKYQQNNKSGRSVSLGVAENNKTHVSTWKYIKAGNTIRVDLGSPSSFKHGGIAPQFVRCHLYRDTIKLHISGTVWVMIILRKQKKHKFQPVSTFINSSLVIIALLLCEEIADVILNETAKDESQAPGRRL
ncbi:hypothetical protein C8Q75DRAFT_730703 [Abortiporus biennis]|nr:hypothetical protein C8Q75DRAFT_730703 [Abortiporus biennis]